MRYYVVVVCSIKERKINHAFYSSSTLFDSKIENTYFTYKQSINRLKQVKQQPKSSRSSKMRYIRQVANNLHIIFHSLVVAILSLVPYCHISQTAQIFTHIFKSNNKQRKKKRKMLCIEQNIFGISLTYSIMMSGITSYIYKYII